MNKNTRQGLKYLLLLIVLFVLINSGCGQRIMRYSPIEIRAKNEMGISGLTGSPDCVAGSAHECESSHSFGLGPHGVKGLHQLVRDQHDYEIVSGIGME